MSNLEGIGIEFDEKMSGWLGIGKKEYVEGRVAGQKEDTPIRFDARIIIDDLDRFINLSEHGARLETKDAEEPQHQREDNHRHQGQPPIHGEEEDQAADEHYHRIEELQKAHAGEHAHQLHIVGGAGEQLTGLGLVVVAEG